MTVPDTSNAERADIAAAPRVVVKVGSSSLTTADGEIDDDRIGALAAALAARYQDGGQNDRQERGQADAPRRAIE